MAPKNSHFVKRCKGVETLIAFTSREANACRAMRQAKAKLLDPAVIGARLRATRQALGIETARELCREAGIGESGYNQFEKGNRPLTIIPALRLCDRFGLTLDWLYRGDRSGLPERITSRLPRFGVIEPIGAAPILRSDKPRRRAAVKGGR